MLTQSAKILISENELKAKIKDLAAKISADYEGEEVLFVGILKGCIHFYSDLTREITVPTTMDFMAISSYGAGTTSSGEVKMLKDLDKSICGKNVIIVEDIIDSGVTLSHLTKYLTLKGAHSVRTCTLLDKPSRRRVEFVPDHCGFEIPDEFVVGYGLDYAEMYRALPFVGVLKPEVYGE
jgi:hypoxanthine phosphoribosyltransferase